MTTPPTTTCNRGDVVLVPFLFSDRPVAKRRPAIVISSQAYHAGRSEMIIAAVTSRVRDPLLAGDRLIEAWQEAGLPKPSVMTAIVRTVKAGMVVRRLGSLAEEDLARMEDGLRLALDLR